MSANGDSHSNKDVRFEATDIATRPVVWSVFGLAVFTLVFTAAAHFYFVALAAREEAAKADGSPLAVTKNAEHWQVGDFGAAAGEAAAGAQRVLEIFDTESEIQSPKEAVKLPALRGEVDLPVPAFSAIKIDGERAYKKARRGEDVAVPIRRSSIYLLDVTAYAGDTATLSMHVSSGTDVRSIAEALGGHCLTLRRTAVGPFDVREASEEMIRPSTALGRLPEDAVNRIPRALIERVLAVGEAVNITRDWSNEPSNEGTPAYFAAESQRLARKYGMTTRFIELAGEINTHMPHYVVNQLAAFLNDEAKPIKGSKVCILGAAYKKDVDDPRESPTFELMKLLIKRGAVISYNDPHVPSLPKMRHYPDLPALSSQALTPEYLAAQDCVLIATDHSAYDHDFIVKHSRMVLDTRNATKNVKVGREKIFKA